MNTDEKIKHLEMVKKSYKVMLKSLQIRLELQVSGLGSGDFFTNVLHSKIKYYATQIEDVALKLDQLIQEQEQR